MLLRNAGEFNAGECHRQNFSHCSSFAMCRTLYGYGSVDVFTRVRRIRRAPQPEAIQVQ